MNYLLLVRMIFVRLGRYKMRTFLMGFAILVTVLATVLIGTVSAAFLDTFEALIKRQNPADSLVLIASGSANASRGSNGLRLSEVSAIAAAIPGIEKWDPVVSGGLKDIKYGKSNARIPLVGASEHADEVQHRGVTEGTFFSAEEIRRRERVALVGSTTARRLFVGSSSVGEQLFIDNMPFEVKGVLESIGSNPHGADHDDVIFVPYTTMMEHMTRNDFVSSARFMIREVDHMESTKLSISEYVRELHGLVEGQQDDFSLITPSLVQEMIDGSVRFVNLFTSIVAGLAIAISSLIVWGIMLAAIKERTPEIGLKKALGARPGDLRREVFIEVALISCAAALAALLLAQVASASLSPVLAARFGVANLDPSIRDQIIGVITAITAGVVGATLPALRAARLDAVAALR